MENKKHRYRGNVSISNTTMGFYFPSTSNHLPVKKQGKQSRRINLLHDQREVYDTNSASSNDRIGLFDSQNIKFSSETP